MSLHDLIPRFQLVSKDLQLMSFLPHLILLNIQQVLHFLLSIADCVDSVLDTVFVVRKLPLLTVNCLLHYL